MAVGPNLIVAGGTQPGKTTMLNCLVSAVPAREGVITCEEVFELRVLLADVVAMPAPEWRHEHTEVLLGD